MHTCTIDDALFIRLQKHATPFIDTPSDVIARALDALEQRPSDPSPTVDSTISTSSVKMFSSDAPPSLTHTTLLGMIIGDRQVLKGVSWNSLMVEVIREAGIRGLGVNQIMDLMEVPAEKGKYDNYSYTFVPQSDISVQGQNSNRAWKQAIRIAAFIKLRLEVSWVWQHKSDAAQPGVRGGMVFEPK